MNTKPDAHRALQTLDQFIGHAQKHCVLDCINGEEGQWFIDKMVDLAEIVDYMPVTYEQDGLGDEAVVFLHYFTSGIDWWITEKDKETEQLQAFGYVSGWDVDEELGYISIQELLENRAELDFHFQPKRLFNVKAKIKGEPMQEERSTSEAIEARIANEMPALSGYLEYDRAWLWYCGPKPTDDQRKYLRDLKFRYKPNDHTMPSGRTGRWFYWDAIPPIHKKNGHSKPKPEPEALSSNGNGKGRVDLSALTESQPVKEETDKPINPDLEARIEALLALKGVA